MDQEITWTVTQSNGKVTSTKKKMPFIKQYNVSGPLDDATKKCLTDFNLMQKALIDNGLMDEK